MKRLTLACALVLCSLFMSPASAAASTAKDTIQTTVEKVRTTVEQEEGKSSAKDLERKLREIIGPVFDFEEMSRLCLGKNWKEGSAEQQQEFITLFSELLARNYLKKIRENAADSKFSITGMTNPGPDRALVKSFVAYKGDQAAIDYRLRLKEGQWKIYDVVIENVGLVSNYRNEFASIIRKEKFDGLLTRLRAKK